MSHLLIFGLGYTAKRIKARMEALGWKVDATGSAGNLDFSDSDAVKRALESSTHVLSSVPPDRKTGEDPVLDSPFLPIRGRRPGNWRVFRGALAIRRQPLRCDALE